MFRLSGHLAFYCGCRFTQQGCGRELSSWFPIVHVGVAVLLRIFFFFNHKSGPPGNRLNMSCCLPSSLCGCHQCNQGTGGCRRLMGWQGRRRGGIHSRGWGVHLTLQLRGGVSSYKTAAAVIGGNSLAQASQSHFQSGHA